MNRFKISLVIPTYNGAHRISSVLNSLQKQLRQPDEIIIVVDGSTDSTIDAIEPWKQKFSNIRVMWQQNGGRAVVRNTGASLAVGDLLVFMDDDMIANPECLLHHELSHNIDDQKIVVGGIDNYAENSDFQIFIKMLSKKYEKSLLQFKDKPLDISNLYLSAANFSILKRDFDLLNGFDSRLTDAEDFDLAVRAFEVNIPIFFNKDALAFHNDQVTGTSYVRRLRQYRAAHIQLRQLEPYRYQGIPIYEPILPSGLKALIFKFFAKRFWIKWLDKTCLKIFVPRIVRFKMYDLIITANGYYYPDAVDLV